MAGLWLSAVPASAQQRLIHGKVTAEAGTPLQNVEVSVNGTSRITMTNAQGAYAINATTGQVLQFRAIGTEPVQRAVGESDVIDVQLRRVATNLDAVVVTALGQTPSPSTA